MRGSCATRRFYCAFYRWNNMLASRNQPASYHGHLSAHNTWSPPRLRNFSSTAGGRMQSPDQITSRPTQSRREAAANGYRKNTTIHMLKGGLAPGENELHNLTSRVRLVMKYVPNPAVVVTALAPQVRDSDDRPSSWPPCSVGPVPVEDYPDPLLSARAMTVSSFSTVSLSPTPVVSFNVRLPSSTWDAINAQKRLRVHFLAPTPRGAHIARTFSLGNSPAGFAKILGPRMAVFVPVVGGTMRCLPNRRFFDAHEDQNQDADANANAAPTAAPEIACRDVSATMDCMLLPDKCITVNDHVIVVAQITDSTSLPRTFPSPLPPHKTALLAYCNRDFHEMGARIRATPQQRYADKTVHFGKQIFGEDAVLTREEAVLTQEEERSLRGARARVKSQRRYTEKTIHFGKQIFGEEAVLTREEERSLRGADEGETAEEETAEGQTAEGETAEGETAEGERRDREERTAGQQMKEDEEPMEDLPTSVDLLKKNGWS